MMCQESGEVVITAISKIVLKGLPGGPVAKTRCSQCRRPGSILEQGTRSHMLQLRVHMLQLKILHATTKIKDPV